MHLIHSENSDERKHRYMHNIVHSLQINYQQWLFEIKVTKILLGIKLQVMHMVYR